MDELTIEGKTYISSKRAAAVTGYAKDYIGQLCREGRVEARLVGRSWYVLESSLRKHRFDEEGTEQPAEEEAVVEAPVESTKPEVVAEVEEAQEVAELPVEEEPIEESIRDEKTNIEAVWEAPTYTSEEVTLMPEVEQPKEITIETQEVEAPIEEVLDTSNNENWKNWFSGTKEEPAETVHMVREAIPMPMSAPEQPASRGTSIPFDIISESKPEKEARPYRMPRRGSTASRNLVLKAVLIAVIVLFLSLAAIGAGFADRGNSNSLANWPIINFLGGTSYINSK